MKNYLRRFRRYLSDEGDSSGDEADYNVTNNNQPPHFRFSEVESGPSSSVSPDKEMSLRGTPRRLRRTRTLSREQKRKISGRDLNKQLSLIDSSEEENSTARLSRRSSVLVKIKKNFKSIFKY